MIDAATLLAYKGWANELLYGALVDLPAAVLTAPSRLIFGDILRTLHHCVAMDEVWQAHLEGRAHGYSTRNPNECPTLSELRDRQERLDQWYCDYAASLEVAALRERVSFRFIGGEPGEMGRGEILLHVANHATYHRGHITALLYEAGHRPPTTDLPVYLQTLKR